MSRTNGRRARPSARGGRRAEAAGSAPSAATPEQGGSQEGAAARGRRAGKKRRPRLRLAMKVSGITAGLGFVGVAILCGVAYAMTEIPPVKEMARAQATVIEFRDGSTMGKIGQRSRIAVSLEEIPDYLEKAVLAAENRDFYDQPLGISFTGIARAIWVNLTTDELQGGSTITQQYAQKAYLAEKRTLSVKFKELFLTIKLEQNLTKDQILENYLNTIYFGRGVYGVEAAAQTYFHKHVSQLNISQAAFLAAVLNSPGNYDPANGKAARQAAIERWKYVIDGMVEEGWLSESKAQKLHFPRKIYPPRTDDTYSGTKGYILKQVISELKSMGFSEQQILTGGLRVRTTIDREMQRAARKSVLQTLGKGWDYKHIETGLVAVKPGTGAVLAMYGGRNYLSKDKFGNVYDARAPVGSSFKPYVLATALEKGIGLHSKFKGNSPQYIANQRFENAGDHDYGMVNLIEATAKSVNTAYVYLGMKVGIDAVQQTAIALGMPEDVVHKRDDASLFLGSIYLHPVTQAAAMATFAAGGVYAEPHLIKEVRGPEGNVLRSVEPETTRVFSKEVAADVAFAMQHTLKPGGTAAEHALARKGREAAGKTGTVEENTAAWFVGYTPRLAAAVAMFKPTGPEGGLQPLVNVPGYGRIAGSTLPAPIWEHFMERVLQNKSPKKFPEPKFVGEPYNNASEEPSGASRSTPTPSTTSSEPAFGVPGEEEATPTPTGGWNSASPTGDPTATDTPTGGPTDEPTDEPTGGGGGPTDEPTDEPTGGGPTDEPTDEPTGGGPTDEPTDEPTGPSDPGGSQCEPWQPFCQEGPEPRPNQHPERAVREPDMRVRRE